ncbi:hypothetical protein PENSOL_c048G00641 [Penicillium solitum]|uniref:Pectate lyase domain-containing protein n=1 Tax=Penicillium solitum TaxID=60172 RepID=A0A1V6QRH9_9EURO|nr:uncharacterized protein PENSOL_c048G00641 [Penicillium solitum]OQD91833.1 hypothetical protein PENSOL_c048G00641 [Penicillium solitum]
MLEPPFTGSHIDILKTGYSTNQNWTSFYGFGPAINVVSATLDHINVTVHNGAARIYVYNTTTTTTTTTTITITNSWLYSGPVSNGPYASGNGTIIAHNVAHNSGSERSSSFLGNFLKDDIYSYDSVAHSVGIGSATYYALETIEEDNALRDWEYGPVVFSAGALV